MGATLREGLDLRPFHLVGRSEGDEESRAFVAEYRNFFGVLLAFVTVDVVRRDKASTTLLLEVQAVADNPVRRVFRNLAEKVATKAQARLVASM